MFVTIRTGADSEYAWADYAIPIILLSAAPKSSLLLVVLLN